MKLERLFSEELAYWIGVAQSDGCLSRIKWKNKIIFRVKSKVGIKSLPMLKKFQELSGLLFDRNAKIFKVRKKPYFTFQFGAKTLLTLFNELNIIFSRVVPPKWILREDKLFGAYLAGVIDGDGDIRVKRPKYPQCAVRIWSNAYLSKLINSIKNIMKCSVNVSYKEEITQIEGRKINSHKHSLEFYISKKNFRFFKKFVIPWMTLEYKREKVKSYIKQRWGRSRDLNPNQRLSILKIHRPLR